MKNHYGKQQLTEQLFHNREYQISHPTYDTELAFYNMVCNGDVENIKKTYSAGSFYDEERGALSDNPIRNARYHLVVTIAMICRFCIEKGMEEQKSYGLSDVYIRCADKATTIAELKEIHRKAVFEYAGEMAAIKKQIQLPKKLYLALDYINDHLNDKIIISDIAEYAEISESQLRRDFQTYLMKTPLGYIQEKKIEFAKSKLEYSDISYVDLANDLGFASHSHFIKIFKEYTDMTPAEYRNRRYRKHFT